MGGEVAQRDGVVIHSFRSAGALAETRFTVLHVEGGGGAGPGDGGIVDIDRAGRHGRGCRTSHRSGEVVGEGGVVGGHAAAIGHHIHVVGGLGGEAGERVERVRQRDLLPVVLALGVHLIIQGPGVMALVVIDEGDGGVVAVYAGGRHAGLHRGGAGGGELNREVVEVPRKIVRVGGEAQSQSAGRGLNTVEIERSHVIADSVTRGRSAGEANLFERGEVVHVGQHADLQRTIARACGRCPEGEPQVMNVVGELRQHQHVNVAGRAFQLGRILP